MAWLKRTEEIAYERVKQQILDGSLPPGSRLVVRSLAKQLGISVNPVVLALRMLEKDGLVVNTPGLGAVVRVRTFEEVMELFQIRAFLEALACRMCAEKASATDLAAVVEAHEAIKRAFEAENAQGIHEADLEFHRAVIRGAHCSDLERTAEYPTLLALSMTVPRLITIPVDRDHGFILEAILRRDPDAAEQAGRAHVENAANAHRGWLEKVCVEMVNGHTSFAPKTDSMQAT